jgi:DNA-binding IclR family transcriptional regulator
MTTNTDEDEPGVAALLDALGDGDCRAIITELTEPMTAKELSEACDIPPSTVYQKVGHLAAVSLLDERTDVRHDGHHTTRYAVAFDALHVELSENRTLTVRADRPERTADERLADMWSEVRKER